MKRFSAPQIGWFLFIIYSALYIYAMSPSVSVGDSGEFIAAAETLSLPHAPSYPLFVLLGKCASVLVPWAHAAYQINFLSALFGAASCAGLFLLAASLGIGTVVSAVLSALFFCSAILREQSAATEVFTLHLFSIIAILVALIPSSDERVSRRKVSLAFFLLGLGLGNHHTLILIAPVFAVTVWLRLSREWVIKGSVSEFLRDGAAWAAFFAAGFSIYLFLPIRSMQNPPIDWSNPETLTNLIRVISRADYGSFSLALGDKLPRNFDSAMGQIVRYVEALAGSLGWTALALSALGWIIWFLRSKTAALGYFLFFAASGAGFLILGNMPFDAQSTGILPRFYLMSSVPLILSAGFFMDEVRKKVPGAQFLFAALPTALLLGNGPAWTQYRRDFFAHDYGRNLLQTLEPGASLYMDGGDDTFYTLAYFHLARGLRPDLSIHDRGGLIFRNPYGDDFRRIPKEMKEERRRQVENTALSLRPLYYSTFNREVLPGTLLMHRGLLSQAVRFAGDPKSDAARAAVSKDYIDRGRYLWQVYSHRGIYRPLHHPSYRLRALLPIYPFLEGVPSGDLGLFRRSAQFGTDIQWLQGNLAWESSVRAFERTSAGNVEEAEKYYRFAIEADPKFVSAYSNLGVLMERKNQLEAAESFYRKAMEVDPKYAEAYYNLAVLYWKKSRWDDVVGLFEKTLALSPNHASARAYLELARFKKAQGAGTK